METDEKHILVVDDDAGIRDLLAKFLRKHSLKVSVAACGDDMFRVLAQQSIHLIILDVMMPGKDGVTLCRELRQSSQVPIVMLTAVAEDVDRIIGLEMGADDYISKPFNPRELLARIKAILRRSQAQPELAVSDALKDKSIYQFSGWIFNTLERRLISPEAIEISLSSGEYNLLQAFLERPNQVLSRDQLLDLTRNRMAGPYDRSIDIQISRLRGKVEADPKSPQIIKTVRGGGYVLAVEVVAS